MVRFVFACAVCLFAVQDSPAAPPAPGAPPAAAIVGRKQIEALLQAPANLDLGNHPTVTVGELLDMLHKRHHLSIRFDIPSLSGMYGFGVGGGAEKVKMVAGRHSPRPALIANLTSNAPAASSAPATPARTLGGPVQQSTYYAPQAGAYAPGSGTAAPTSPSPPNSPVAKEPSPKSETPPAPAKETDTAAEFLQQAGKIEVAVATIDGQSITVATALRLALDAFPNIDADDSAGMPLAMTNATLLDFLVEDDGILITTRLKALTYKETRVYSIKNLKNANPTELSKVICQSIRPWSWRSRIDDLGEQLKSGMSNIPPSMLASLMKSGMELATEETGIAVDASEKTDAPKPESPKTDEKKVGPSEEAQEAAMLGSAVANSIVTLAHASLTTLEVVHYADPPTGSIRVLPGKLIITQSQAAHREIAELLKQLSDE
jgi:hypothetical protein